MIDQRSHIAVAHPTKPIEQILQENITDPLTKIGNLLYWQERLAVLSESQFPIGIIIIDIKDFKQFNDRYGHLFGDQVLFNIAQIIKRSVRNPETDTEANNSPGDEFARIGGDEFAIAFSVPDPNHSPDEVAQLIIDRIQKNLEDLNQKYPNTKKVELSIGCATSSQAPPHDLYQLIADADKKMYAHKQSQKELLLVDGAGI